MALKLYQTYLGIKKHKLGIKRNKTRETFFFFAIKTKNAFKINKAHPKTSTQNPYF